VIKAVLFSPLPPLPVTVPPVFGKQGHANPHLNSSNPLARRLLRARRQAITCHAM
jgi:hypothetical protein